MSYDHDIIDMVFLFLCTAAFTVCMLIMITRKNNQR